MSGIKVSRSGPTISKLLYADDSNLFSTALVDE